MALGLNTFSRKLLGDKPDFDVQGNQARDQRDWVNATAAYRSHLDLKPADSAIWVQLGHSLKEQGDLDAAERAYREATTIVPDDADGWLHLAHLLKRLKRDRDAVVAFENVMRLTPTIEARDELKLLGVDVKSLGGLASEPRSENVRYLELRDLFQYLDQHDTVTGISRVVLGIVNHVLNVMTDAEGQRYQFVHQLGNGDGLSLLNRRDLRRILQIATGKAGQLESMKSAISQARRAATVVEPRRGDVYFIPGAFWDAGANSNFLPSLKANGVVIGAYIYDLIPITHAHYCMAGLTIGFNIAYAETAPFYDFTLTISKFVAEQVTNFNKKNGLKDFPTIPVPLAHELRFEGAGLATGRLSQTVEMLQTRDFVLCVCTIEARKNHIYLFSIWQEMIDEGMDVPDLVFVGRYGWRINDLVGQIEASRYLDGRLHILQGVSDEDLSALYDACLFTVFPSFVEGWGLPVGESLSHGKIPVASSVTSIPEVGGDLAVYIDPFDMHSGAKAIRRLIVDTDHRAALETKIRLEFRPRTWVDVGHDFFTRLEGAISAVPREDGRRQPLVPVIEAGELLELRTIDDLTAQRHHYLKQPIRLVFASGWGPIDSGGTWLRSHTGEIRFKTSLAEGSKVSLIILASTSTAATPKTTLRAWATPGRFERSTLTERTYLSRPLQPDYRAWLSIDGTIGADGNITVQLQLVGEVERDAASLGRILCVHSFGYAAQADFDNRLRLLSGAVLPSF